MALTAMGVFLLAQLVPYGRDHDNPAVVTDAPWPSADAGSIARASCYDCHSNETEWPWYSTVAPMSWLVASDVADGRVAMNFSEWPRDEHQLRDAVDEVEGGSMPPSSYRLLHPGARLSAEEKRRLVAALVAMDEARTRGRRGPDRGRG